MSTPGTTGADQGHKSLYPDLSKFHGLTDQERINLGVKKDASRVPTPTQVGFVVVNKSDVPSSMPPVTKPPADAPKLPKPAFYEAPHRVDTNYSMGSRAFFALLDNI